LEIDLFKMGAKLGTLPLRFYIPDQYILIPTRNNNLETLLFSFITQVEWIDNSLTNLYCRWRDRREWSAVTINGTTCFYGFVLTGRGTVHLSHIVEHYWAPPTWFLLYSDMLRFKKRGVVDVSKYVYIHVQIRVSKYNLVYWLRILHFSAFTYDCIADTEPTINVQKQL
jgi:hypothetical protein